MLWERERLKSTEADLRFDFTMQTRTGQKIKSGDRPDPLPNWEVEKVAGRGSRMCMGHWNIESDGRENKLQCARKVTIPIP